MMTQMQTKYAEKPVRFILVPCNQFSDQEPAANSVIKAFAEKSVRLAKAGAGSNVIMLAKSNLNGVKCTYAGADACMPSSTECCPTNDAVYDYLLAKTPPGTIGWNFDKIVTGFGGKPYSGETIVDGSVLGDQLSAVIDRLLAEGGHAAIELQALPGSGDVVGMLLLAGACAATLLAACRAFRWRQSREQDVASRYTHLLA